MSGYVCGTCRKAVATGATFCVNCETFFDEAAPDVLSCSGQVVYLTGAETRSIRNRRTVSQIAGFVAILAFVGIVSILGLGPAVKTVRSSSFEQMIQRSLEADAQADRDGTFASRAKAMDLMVIMATGATVRHARGLSGNRDLVILIAPDEMSLSHAAKCARFAFNSDLNVRKQYLETDEAQDIRVHVYNHHGVLLAAKNA